MFVFIGGFCCLKGRAPSRPSVVAGFCESGGRARWLRTPTGVAEPPATVVITPRRAVLLLRYGIARSAFVALASLSCTSCSATFLAVGVRMAFSRHPKPSCMQCMAAFHRPKMPRTTCDGFCARPPGPCARAGTHGLEVRAPIIKPAWKKRAGEWEGLERKRAVNPAFWLAKFGCERLPSYRC